MLYSFMPMTVHLPGDVLSKKKKKRESIKISEKNSQYAYLAEDEILFSSV